MLCFALALWNGQDPILKERLFGLTGPQGNHGEDVKEVYYYLDSTPTHSWLVGLYKYPQRAYPYADLVETNARRSRVDPEYELIDTGVFSDNRYFDVQVEYAKADAEDLLIQISLTNRGPDSAPLHVLPTLWFRNTWSWPPDVRWGTAERPAAGQRPSLRRDFSAARILAEHGRLGRYVLDCDTATTAAGVVSPGFLFTENETNARRLYQAPNATRFVKDGINDAVVDGKAGAVNLDGVGTRAAAHYVLTIAAGETVRLRLRLRTQDACRVRRRAVRPLRRAPHRPSERCRRVLRGPAADGSRRGRSAYSAPGLRRSAVEQAVLSLQRPGLAPGGPRLPAPAAGTAKRPQPRVAAPQRGRRHVDAG